MKREALAVLIGLALGLVTGLAWQGHRAAAAEKRAHTADSLYKATAQREVLAKAERATFDSARADSLRAVNIALTAAKDTVTAIRVRAKRTTARAGEALAQAATLADTAETYRSLYVEAAGQRDDALAAADSAHAAAGRLLAIIRADSLELQRERGRAADWKRAADSLALANADLMAHRRPEFNLKLGLGGFLSGAATATVVCVATKRCG
jgi:hypothetical protein